MIDTHDGVQIEGLDYPTHSKWRDTNADLTPLEGDREDPWDDTIEAGTLLLIKLWSEKERLAPLLDGLASGQADGGTIADLRSYVRDSLEPLRPFSR